MSLDGVLLTVRVKTITNHALLSYNVVFLIFPIHTIFQFVMNTIHAGQT